MKYYFKWILCILFLCLGTVLFFGIILPKNINFEKHPIFAFYQIFGILIIFIGLFIGFGIPYKKSLT